MSPEEARERFAGARVARLATLGPAGPHLVPVTFALENGVIWTAVDEKPKATRSLQRLRNIATDPRVSLLADEYRDEDWSRLCGRAQTEGPTTSTTPLTLAPCSSPGTRSTRASRLPAPSCASW